MKTLLDFSLRPNLPLGESPLDGLANFKFFVPRFEKEES